MSDVQGGSDMKDVHQRVYRLILADASGNAISGYSFITGVPASDIDNFISDWVLGLDPDATDSDGEPLTERDGT